MTETVSSPIYTSNFCGCCLGETSLLPSIVRGVEAWRFTVLRAASTQSDLVLNCDNGVQVSWEDAGFVVWFHRIQAEVSSKAARFTRAIVNAFFAPSYTSISLQARSVGILCDKAPQRIPLRGSTRLEMPRCARLARTLRHRQSRKPGALSKQRGVAAEAVKIAAAESLDVQAQWT
jgi:hypothetical protein